MDVHGGSSSAHIPNFKMHEGWSSEKARLKISTKILVQFSMSTNEMNHPFWGYSPDSKFTVSDDVLSLSIYIYTK